MTRDVVGATVIRPLRLLVKYWPQLAACYLLGLLLRHATIELAAWAGYDNNWWASLIMPMAGVARLGSYVAMFLVLRPALPVLAPAAAPKERRVDVFSTVIVPFFAIYIAWKMFRQDWIAFETRALDYRIDDAVVAGMAGQQVEFHQGSLPVGSTTWLLIVAALVLRWALSRVKDRLPTPMVAVRIYIDALWVFLVLSFSANRGLTLLLNPTEWIAQRRIIVWFSETRTQLFSHFQPLEAAWDVLSWVARTTFGGLAVPLMWLGYPAGDSRPLVPAAGLRARKGKRARERTVGQIQTDHRCRPRHPARRHPRAGHVRRGLHRTGLAGPQWLVLRRRPR